MTSFQFFYFLGHIQLSQRQMPYIFEFLAFFRIFCTIYIQDLPFLVIRNDENLSLLSHFPVFKKSRRGGVGVLMRFCQICATTFRPSKPFYLPCLCKFRRAFTFLANFTFIYMFLTYILLLNTYSSQEMIALLWHKGSQIIFGQKWSQSQNYFEMRIQIQNVYLYCHSRQYKTGNLPGSLQL